MLANTANACELFVSFASIRIQLAFVFNSLTAVSDFDTVFLFFLNAKEENMQAKFVLSKKLARRVSRFMPWFSLNRIRQGLGNRFISFLSGVAAVMRMSARKQSESGYSASVIVEPGGHFSQELLSKLQRDFGLPKASKRFYTELCQEFAAWLESLGGSTEGYKWGRADLQKDGSVKLTVFPLAKEPWAASEAQTIVTLFPSKR